MSDYISLSCPSCGGSLEISDDIERFACAYCGKEHLVKRGGGIVSLAPVLESIKEVQTGVDKTASELAITRLDKEIGQLQKEISNEKNESIFELGGSVGFGVGFLVAAFSENLIAGIVVWIVLALIISVSEYKSKEEKLISLRKKLAQKEQELAKHKSIVSL